MFGSDEGDVVNDCADADDGYGSDRCATALAPLLDCSRQQCHNVGGSSKRPGRPSCRSFKMADLVTNLILFCFAIHNQ